MSNQDVLSQMSGNQPASQDHETEHVIYGAIEDFIILSLLIWLIKKMFRHPLPALVFLAFGTAAVGSAMAIGHDELLFYPLAFVALCGLGRVIR